jgi:hypothetical protein
VQSWGVTVPVLVCPGAEMNPQMLLPNHESRSFIQLKPNKKILNQQCTWNFIAKCEVALANLAHYAEEKKYPRNFVMREFSRPPTPAFTEFLLTSLSLWTQRLILCPPPPPPSRWGRVPGGGFFSSSISACPCCCPLRPLTSQGLIWKHPTGKIWPCRY